MTKWQLDRDGGPWDYPTLGFTAIDGAILDGALSNPVMTDPPDPFWTVYVGASGETGVTRWGQLLHAPAPAEPTTGSVLVYDAVANRSNWVEGVDAFAPGTSLGDGIEGRMTTLDADPASTFRQQQDARLATDYQNAIPVTRYGAKGDAYLSGATWTGTDDTAAIQAADDAASSIANHQMSSARNGPVQVYFPAGNYLTTGTINKSPRTVWVGPGVRYINSATASRNAQGAQIVSAHNGAAVTIRGTLGSGILQSGKITGLSFLCADDTLYTLAQAITCLDDLREHYFIDVYTIGFKYGFFIQNCLALKFYGCYVSNATDTGIYAEGNSASISQYGEFYFTNNQFAGAKYAGYFRYVSNSNGLGNRWQVSGVANLYIEQCTNWNHVGGYIDSASAAETVTTGYGLHLRDSTNMRFTDVIYYSNGPDTHVLMESTDAARPTKDVAVTGAFHPGSSLTPVAVTCNATGTGVLRDIVVGGQFGELTASTWITPVAGNYVPAVIPSTGGPMRAAQPILPRVDNDSTQATLGSSASRWNRVIAATFREYAASGDAQARMQLAGTSIQWGPGGATAPDSSLERGGTDFLRAAAGDSLGVADGTWNGGRFRMGAYHLWIDSSGRLRIKSGAPTSDTDGTVVGTQV